MEERKLYNFLIFNKTNKSKSNASKNNKRASFQIGTLFYPEEVNVSNKITNQFNTNKTNFFKSNNIKVNKYNKTDIKFPNLNLKARNDLKYNNIYKTVNYIKENLYKMDDNNSFNRIFKKFQMYNQKYDDVTRYFKFFIKEGNNNPKIQINKKTNNFKHISSISKPKSIKYCFNAFQRIKSIQ